MSIYQTVCLTQSIEATTILVLLVSDDMMDFEATQLRPDSLNGALLARAATRLSEDILKQ